LAEAQMLAEKVVLDEENTTLKSQLAIIQEEMIDLRQKYEVNSKANRKLENNKSERKLKAEKQVKILEIERATAVANSAVLETQLKKKMETEHTLASQVSELASKLAESASSNSEATNGYIKRVDSLQLEKMASEKQVTLLTQKLQHVIRALNCMSQEQERIVTQAADFEETMHSVSQEQNQIMADAARQEQILIDAAREREQIVSILTRQAVEIEKTTAERERIIKAVSNQSANMETAKFERDELFEQVTKQKSVMATLVSGIQELGIREASTESFEDDESESDSDSDDDDDDDDDIADDTDVVRDMVSSAYQQDSNIEESASAFEAVEVVKNATITEDIITSEDVIEEMEEEVDVECRLADGRTAEEVLKAAMEDEEEDDAQEADAQEADAQEADDVLLLWTAIAMNIWKLQQ